MKITKTSKFLPEQQLSTSNSLLISSDLSVQSLYQILTKNQALINKTDKKGETFMSYALKRKKDEVSEFLLTSPVLDLTFQDDQGNSYLHLSALTQNDVVALGLIKKGIEINMKNFKGNTALHYAFMKDDTKMKNILIEHGADLTIKNNEQLLPDEVTSENTTNDLIDKDPSVNVSYNISKEINKSIRMEWSEANVVNQYNKKFNLSNTNSNIQTYANSFVEPVGGHMKTVSSDTRYNSNNKNIEDDFDLFDLTNSIDNLKKENNDKVLLTDDIQYQKKSTLNEEGDDLVNTRFSREDSNHIVCNDYKALKEKQDKEEIKENGKDILIQPPINNENKNFNETNNTIKAQINFDDDPFAFSSPKIKEIKEENGLTTDTKPHIGILPDVSNLNHGTINNSPPAIPSQISNGSETGISSQPLFQFLSKIQLEKYYTLLNSNGFDDISLIISQTKSGTGVTDDNLKETGIKLPGDRAKILILIQQAAGNFPFEVPKSVYYTCEDLTKVEEDYHIKKLNNWLKGLKVEAYLNNFVVNGYHSLELLQLQMESKQPLTNEILQNELGIDKLGYRARILNKLTEEGRILWNKLKTSILIVDKGTNNNGCECVIF